MNKLVFCVAWLGLTVMLWFGSVFLAAVVAVVTARRGFGPTPLEATPGYPVIVWMVLSGALLCRCIPEIRVAGSGIVNWWLACVAMCGAGWVLMGYTGDTGWYAALSLLASMAFSFQYFALKEKGWV